MRATQSAANALGLELQVLNASSERDFDAAFAKLIELRAGGLVISADPIFFNSMEQLANLTVRHSVPAVSPDRKFAAAGGLAGYGADNSEAYRLAGIYAGSVLKGEKPADLPVVQSSKFELVINVSIARMLGLTVPDKLLVAADEVFE